MRLKGVIRCTGHPCNAWFDRPKLEEKTYIKAARWFPLSIHPFTSIAQIFYAGIAAADDDDDNGDGDCDDDDDRYTRVIVIYTLLSFI